MSKLHYRLVKLLKSSDVPFVVDMFVFSISSLFDSFYEFTEIELLGFISCVKMMWMQGKDQCEIPSLRWTAMASGSTTMTSAPDVTEEF